MAHADYACCAVCDRKMYYDPWAEAKTEICSDCVANLATQGVIVHNTSELLAWIKSTDADTVGKVLANAGFRFCHYWNPIDEAVENKGFKPDEHRGLTPRPADGASRRR